MKSRSKINEQIREAITWKKDKFKDGYLEALYWTIDMEPPKEPEKEVKENA